MMPSGAVYNPACGKKLYDVRFDSISEISDKIKKSRHAFAAWSAESPLKRARVLFRFLELMTRHRAELEKIVTREHGKTLEDAHGEVQRGMEVIEFACGIPHLLKGEFSENVGKGVDCYSMRQPLGVVAGISPFNFPVMIPLWMFPLALACGNTFLLKPSEVDPGPSHFMLDLFQQAKPGHPDILQVINGGKEAVDTLLAHPDIDAVSFVGSTPVAQKVHQTGSANGKRVQALGGAKNHMLIMQDALLPQAVEALIGAAYGSAGERCMAISVAVVVGDDTADQLIAALKQRIPQIRIGDGESAQTEMGPLISQKHLEKVRIYIDTGVAEGADLVVDGRECPVKGEGFFLGPSLFDRVKPEMKIYQEEIFGPVLCVVRVQSFEEALTLINAHPFGNGAAVFTGRGSVARAFSQRVKAGMVGINVPIPVPMSFYSFGGWKRSLFGDAAMHGMEGIRFYTHLKTMTARWPEQANTAEFSMPVSR